MSTPISGIKPTIKEDYNSLMQSVMQSVNNPSINGINILYNIVKLFVLVSNQFLNYFTDQNRSPLLQTFMSNPSGLNSVFKSATLPNNNNVGIGAVTHAGACRPLTGLISNLDSINNVLSK